MINMLSLYTTVLCAVLQISTCRDMQFPPNFQFGTSTAAYQIEGGWNADGKGESVWDRYVHQSPSPIYNNDTGDIATNSYQLWREDVKIAAEMRLQFYRFSISWTRILPNGFTNEINQAGVKYYSDLIDALLDEGIEPILTLYHWDLPVKIQDLGGWTNPLIVKWFGDYARVIYSLYAGRVKTWITINEPAVMCDYFYNSGEYAPGVKEPVFGPYLCNKHLLLAHATAYRIFDREFRSKYPGRISLANHLLWFEPRTPKDAEVAELGQQFLAGRYCHPIYSKKGGWPPSIEKVMLEYSLKQGYNESRLPAFTKREIEFIKGTADYFGMNHYTTFSIREATSEDEPGIWFTTGSPEINAILEQPADWDYGASTMLPIYPKGIRKQMAWVKKQYGDVDILITENGYSTSGYELNDTKRIDFIRDYLEQVLLSINEDKVSVIGYSVWSLLDNFEWLSGFSVKFGLYEVNYEDPNLSRTGRRSSKYYASVIKNRSLNVSVFVEQ